MSPDARSRLTALFTKRPLPGQVKTRLCPPLGPEAAAELAEAMLRDMAERCARARAFRTALCFAPPEDGAWFRAELPELEDQRPQRGSGLGQRLASFVADAFARAEARTVVVIGSDQPLVTSARIAEAHRALESGAGCVLGPDQGGGYYLIGLSASQPELFTDVAMSSAGMLAATKRLAEARGLALVLLPPSLDVDTGADLERLRAELGARSEREAALDLEFPRRTALVLRRLFPLPT